MFSIQNILSIHCVGLKYWYTDNMKNNYELCTDLARSQTCNMKNNKSKSLLKYIYLSWYSNYRSNRPMLPQDPVQLIIVYQVKLTEPRSIILQHRGGTYITSDTANFQIAAVFQPFPRLVFFCFSLFDLWIIIFRLSLIWPDNLRRQGILFPQHFDVPCSIMGWEPGIVISTVTGYTSYLVKKRI
jgi:hypothetical protein